MVAVGGAEWSLEDTIDLKGARLVSREKSRDLNRQVLLGHNLSGGMSGECSQSVSVESSPALQLDWVSAENGSHILTVCTGTKISFYTAVSSDVAAASKKDSKISVSQ